MMNKEEEQDFKQVAYDAIYFLVNIVDLEATTPNDQEFGKKVREIINKEL